MTESPPLDTRSLALRRTIVDVLSHSRRGHVGASFSLVEILRVLFDDVMRYDAARPGWPERDRFILSKGHGCLALYVLLAEKGFFPKEELAKFCAFDGILGGHPDARKIPGVVTSTGSLGHGPAFGVGMALHARMRWKTLAGKLPVPPGEETRVDGLPDGNEDPPPAPPQAGGGEEEAIRVIKVVEAGETTRGINEEALGAGETTRGINEEALGAGGAVEATSALLPPACGGAGGGIPRVFVVTGDGECDEGSVWEAALMAGKHGLDNFTLLVDYNKMQSYGPVREVQDLEPFLDKWRAFGFGATDVDGHDVEALRSVLTRLPLEPGKPSAIVCHTIKGKGIPFAEQDPGWHHRNRMKDDELARLYVALETP